MLKNKKLLIITSLLILLPILAGLLLWDKLPEQLPSHWNAAGEVDGYSSRSTAVIGLPLFLLAVHWLCLFVTQSDKKNNNQNLQMLGIALWVCPIISVFGTAAMYGSALGHSVNMVSLPCLLVGVMFLIVGNYLPKCKHNYTIGIKLPWTLASEENWNATHRIGGRVWFAGGFIIALGTLLPEKLIFPCMMAVILVCILIPTIYSYRYSKKHG